MKKLCGLRPTGRLHIGYYFYVILPARHDAKVLVANYHAPQEQNLDELIDILKKFGVKSIKM